MDTLKGMDGTKQGTDVNEVAEQLDEFEFSAVPLAEGVLPEEQIIMLADWGCR
jgi:hypothetical protein